MAVKTKTFDCVEMKRECQRRMREEYEAHKDEFADYYDFITARARQSELGKAVRAKIAAPGTGS